MNCYGRMFYPSVPSVPSWQPQIEPVLVGTEFYDYTYSISELYSNSPMYDYPIGPIEYNNIPSYGMDIFTQPCLYRQLPLYYYQPNPVACIAAATSPSISYSKCPQINYIQSNSVGPSEWPLKAVESQHSMQFKSHHSMQPLSAQCSNVSQFAESQWHPQYREKVEYSKPVPPAPLSQNVLVDNGPQPVVQPAVNALIKPSTEQDFHLSPGRDRKRCRKYKYRPPEVIAEYIEILDDRYRASLHCRPAKGHRRVKYVVLPNKSSSNKRFEFKSCDFFEDSDEGYSHSPMRSSYCHSDYRGRSGASEYSCRSSNYYRKRDYDY